MHFFSFFGNSTISKIALSSQSERWMRRSRGLVWRSHVSGVIVVIVALAGLVVLGGGAGSSRRTTAEMHPMTLASSGTPSTQPVAVALAFLAAILGKYAEGTTDCGYKDRLRRSRRFLADGTARAKPMEGVYLLLEYPNNIRDNKQRKDTHPMLIPCLSLYQIPMKFR